MDSNNMYQNQQTGGAEPENNQSNAYNQNAYEQNPYQDQNYQQYPYNNTYNNNGYNYNSNYQTPYQQAPQMDLEEPVKMSEWLITLLIMMVPCVNLVMMFIWAFSKSEKKSKSNYFKANLIFFGIILVLYLILIFLVVAAGMAGLF